ncbi:hypothetical protein WJX84_010289 [Apatococcus fuscideae]|uniref:AAR2 N-terminal domain-containing protein n=1 Tax=Apatococcus fuscideae TaxID=2026836 RepID=A0AAW1SJM1_9CHLO
MASTAPYSISLNPDVARQLNHLGGTVLLLDVPPALILGFDQQTFQVGQKFKGLKMIPPGVHLLSFCQLSQTGQVAAYAGRFLSLAEGQVVVMRWDASVEALTDLPDQDEVDRYTLGVRRYDFDAGLAPYNLSAYATWQRLSGHITPAVIEQLQPTPQAWFSITAEEEPEGSRQQTKAEQQLSHQLSQRDGNPSLQPGCEQAGRDDADLPTRMQSLSTGVMPGWGAAMGFSGLPPLPVIGGVFAVEGVASPHPVMQLRHPALPYLLCLSLCGFASPTCPWHFSGQGCCICQ